MAQLRRILERRGESKVKPVIRRVNRVSVLIGDDHPMAEMRSVSGYILRGRLVLAEKIGRPLRPEEVCHHRNGNGIDDRPENLRLFESNGKHTKYHARLRREN